ncbi:STAS-like domain-containing protein [Deinococcus sp. 6GRE01]|nr:STAS-like domain-containing protein [Deinococcus sp. 6GRE01]
MTEKHYYIADEFSKYPVGRIPADGKYNGERFRKEVLIPLIKSYDKVFIHLDGTRGYGSSFLEESFGGLVRYFDTDAKNKISKLIIVTRKPHWQQEVQQYIEDALKIISKRQEDYLNGQS